MAAIIGVLAGAFVYLWKTNEDFRQKITSIWGEITASTGGFIVDINSMLGAFGAFVLVGLDFWPVDQK